MKKNIKIILLGRIDGDPTIYSVTNELVKKLSANKTNLIFGFDDLEAIKDFDANIEKTQNLFNDGQFLVEKCHLKGSFKTFPSKRQIWNLDDYPLPQALERNNYYNKLLKKSQVINVTNHLVLNSLLLRELYIIPDVIKLKNTLRKLDIKHIDMEGEKGLKKIQCRVINENNIDNLKNLSEKALYHYQIGKVKRVVDDIVTNHANCNENIILWIATYDIVRFLGAAIHYVTENFASQDNNYKNFNFLPIVFKMSSHYTNQKLVKENMHEEAIKMSRSEDAVKLCYRKVIVHDFVFVENVATRMFHSAEFDNVVEDLIKSEFVIPSFNQDKERIITELGGIIKQVNKKNFALIKIDSKKLTKDVRLKLGIDRKCVTLDSLYVEDQKAFLRKIPNITIDYTRNSKKILMTYPKLMNSKLREVCHEWEKSQEVADRLDSKVKETSVIKTQLITRHNAKKICNNK